MLLLLALDFECVDSAGCCQAPLLDRDSAGSSSFGPSDAAGRTLKLWLGISMVRLELVSAETG